MTCGSSSTTNLRSECADLGCRNHSFDVRRTSRKRTRESDHGMYRPQARDMESSNSTSLQFLGARQKSWMVGEQNVEHRNLIGQSTNQSADTGSRSQQQVPGPNTIALDCAVRLPETSSAQQDPNGPPSAISQLLEVLSGSPEKDRPEITERISFVGRQTTLSEHVSAPAEQCLSFPTSGIHDEHGLIHPNPNGQPRTVSHEQFAPNTRGSDSYSPTVGTPMDTSNKDGQRLARNPLSLHTDINSLEGPATSNGLVEWEDPMAQRHIFESPGEEYTDTGQPILENQILWQPSAESVATVNADSNQPITVDLISDESSTEISTGAGIDNGRITGYSNSQQQSFEAPSGGNSDSGFSTISRSATTQSLSERILGTNTSTVPVESLVPQRSSTGIPRRSSTAMPRLPGITNGEKTWSHHTEALSLIINSRSEVIRKHHSSDIKFVLELSRLRLLQDAIRIEDTFYLALHEIYCWNTPPKCSQQDYQANTPLNQGFRILSELILSNLKIPEESIDWYTKFPSSFLPPSSVYQNACQEVWHSIALLGKGWTQFKASCVDRKCPPLVDYMMVDLGVQSRTMQRIMHTAITRSFWPPPLDMCMQSCVELLMRNQDVSQQWQTRRNTVNPPSKEEMALFYQGLVRQYRSIYTYHGQHVNTNHHPTPNRPPHHGQPTQPHSNTGSSSHIFDGNNIVPRSRPTAMARSDSNSLIIQAGTNRLTRSQGHQSSPFTSSLYSPAGVVGPDSQNSVHTSPSSATFDFGVGQSSRTNDLNLLAPSATSSPTYSPSNRPYYYPIMPDAASSSLIPQYSNPSNIIHQIPRHRPNHPHSQHLPSRRSSDGNHYINQRMQDSVSQRMVMPSKYILRSNDGSITPNFASSPREASASSKALPNISHQPSQMMRSSNVPSNIFHITPSGEGRTYPYPEVLLDRLYNDSTPSVVGSSRVNPSSLTRSHINHTSHLQSINPPNQAMSFPNVPLFPILGYTLSPTAPINANSTALHQAHVRSPILRIADKVGKLIATTDQAISYYQYLSGFGLEPTLIAPETRKIYRTFQVPTEILSRIPKDMPGKCGAPSTRRVHSGTLVPRLRCVKLSKKREMSENEWSVTETNWPSNISVMLNNSSLELRLKSHHGKDLPVDIIPFIHPGSNSSNSLDISLLRIGNTVDPTAIFLIAIELIAVADLNDAKALVQEVDATNMRTRIKDQLTNKDPDIMIMNADIVIDITDPFSSCLIDTPIRGKHCLHYECFDLDVFFQTRRGSPCAPEQFKCPICGSDARPQSLLLDRWFLEMLNAVKARNVPDARAIVVDDQVNWRVKEAALDGESGDGDGVRTKESLRAKSKDTAAGSRDTEIIEID